MERAFGKLGPAKLTGQSSPKLVELDLIVLEGDFNDEDDDSWTREKLESRVIKEREGKRPVLTGDLQVTLKKGVGTLGDMTFTDNSSWIKSRKFRLGLKVASGYCEGIRILEAKTDAFTVKDHRGECELINRTRTSDFICVCTRLTAMINLVRGGVVVVLEIFGRERSDGKGRDK
ncbi:hypothetical protein NC651_010225 [Populus alba x Populus x berolinensis]|nr:hypothetical protein NC651_010225 [Populus alba x Populus x berolinensis]